MSRTPAWASRMRYHAPEMHERDIERPWRWAAVAVGAALLVFLAGAAAVGCLR